MLGRGPTRIFRGRDLWDEFYEEAGVANCNSVSLFDKHNVADTLTNFEAEQSGGAIDFMPGIRSVLLSYGRRHRKGTFDRNTRYYPFISSMDGYIFTDFPQCWKDDVEVYRENWMPKNCITIRGDKGQAAELLVKPALV